MPTGELARIQLNDDERADIVLILDRLSTAGWQVYHVTTRTDEPMVMEPGAGARYKTPACELDVEYVAMGVSVGIEGLGEWENHELLIHACGRHASHHNPSQPNDDDQKLVNVLSVLTAYQDRLTPDTYAEFGRDLLMACDSIEYYGDEGGPVYGFTQEDLDVGELPVTKSR
ncbi:hypothetical protein [Actinomadura rubrisoli]|uniref:Uncharacterized protein n=1 Tax=Actinomadura rubrisoli TaxID=2530368 RepID=A0A4R5CE30_9ACTN|nr:hypothetical protein [Actinomadura rubrisoli]TDD95424.1 hypothetical protein E1298_04745 [Actinomadura rubrisoli]